MCQAVGKSQPWKNNTPKPNKATKPQARSAQRVFGEGFGSFWDGNRSVNTAALSWEGLAGSCGRG